MTCPIECSVPAVNNAILTRFAAADEYTRLVLGRRDVDGRVRRKKVSWLEHHLVDLDGPAQTATLARGCPWGRILGEDHHAEEVDNWKQTYITGQSSILGLCVNPNTAHTTGPHRFLDPTFLLSSSPF